MKISKSALRALLAHASTDSFRPHMQGIAFSPAGDLLCATDGYRLGLVWSDAHEGDKRKPYAGANNWLALPREEHIGEWRIIPRATIDQVLALGGKARKGVEDAIAIESIAVSRVRVSIERVDGLAVPSFEVDTLDGFPAVSEVFPAWWKAGEWSDTDRTANRGFGVNLGYLTDAQALVSALSEGAKSSRTCARIHPGATALDPIVVEGHFCAVLVMPVRV